MTCDVLRNSALYHNFIPLLNKPFVNSDMNGLTGGVENGANHSRLRKENQRNHHQHDSNKQNCKGKTRFDRTKDDEYQRAKRELMKNPNFVRFENGWSEHISRSGKHYYFHFQTNRTVWEKPAEMSQPKQSTNLVRVEGEWSEHISSSGNHYYYNSRTKESVWEKPKGFFSDLNSKDIPNQTPTSNGPQNKDGLCGKDRICKAPDRISGDCADLNIEDHRTKTTLSKEAFKLLVQQSSDRSASSAGTAPVNLDQYLELSAVDESSSNRKRPSRSQSQEPSNNARDLASNVADPRLNLVLETPHCSASNVSQAFGVETHFAANPMLPNGASVNPATTSESTYSNIDPVSSTPDKTTARSLSLQNSECFATPQRSATEDWAFISNCNTRYASGSSRKDGRMDNSKSVSSKRSRNSESNQQTPLSKTEVETSFADIEASASPCKRARIESADAPKLGSKELNQTVKREVDVKEEPTHQDLPGSPSGRCSPGVSDDGILGNGGGGELPESPRREELPPSTYFYDPELVMHIVEWPTASLEAHVLKNMQEESKHSLQTFQTAVDLKFLRSVVRANEIQATLQQARIHFIREQILELENTNVSLGVGTSIESGNSASSSSACLSSASVSGSFSSQSVSTSSASSSSANLTSDHSHHTAFSSQNRLSQYSTAPPPPATTFRKPASAVNNPHHLSAISPKLISSSSTFAKQSSSSSSSHLAASSHT